MGLPPLTTLTGVPTALPSSPTRRRLIALLATLAVSDQLVTGAASAAPAPEDVDPIALRQLFAAFQNRVTEHERAYQRCSRLEVQLAATVGYPRVRLPRVAGQPAQYAADPVTITEHVRPGPRRDRLQRLLRRRQERWDEAARAAGLREAQEREDALFRIVRETADALYALPAATTADVLRKLVTLLSLEEPGRAFRDVAPWRELRLILADLGGLANFGGRQP